MFSKKWRLVSKRHNARAVLVVIISIASVAVNGSDLLKFVKISPNLDNEATDYSKAQVYRITTNSTRVLSSLNVLYSGSTLDFWGPPSISTDILIATPKEEALLRSTLPSLDESTPDDAYTLSITIPDVQRLLPHDPPSILKTSSATRSGSLTWDAYHGPQAIMDWMESMTHFYPESTSLIQIGESGEGLPLIIVKISSDTETHNKRAIFIDATTHAREWITTSTATWIIKELAMGSVTGRSLLDRFDFYILPLLNPDGYRHSWEYNRLWRKSRRSTSDWLLSCSGVDLNRNWGHEWGGAGSGSLTCSQIYKGQAPFSEPETRAVRDFVKNGDVKWVAYFSLHSYGQKWLTPWGYTDKVLPKDYIEMIRVARIGAKALKTEHGTEYEVGSTSDVLYLAAGGSDDWWKGVVGVKYAYTLELRDSGLFGFLLPTYQIKPTAEETWTGIAAAIKAIP